MGIVGPGGSGKSTLVSLVEGFHRPAGGRILPDGFDMNEIDLRVSLPGYWSRLKWTQDEQRLNVKLPDTPPGASAVTLKIKGVV
jgi:ABC-type cobalamin/Fe3+-siderophores transport system ATPase subunit